MFGGTPGNVLMGGGRPQSASDAGDSWEAIGKRILGSYFWEAHGAAGNMMQEALGELLESARMLIDTRLAPT